jgi:D-3-phosphoglycerate dehydrogenase
VIGEDDLRKSLDRGKVSFAGIDVYENEPTPKRALLEHDKVSLTPHIGASTNEGQERVWLEMANLLIDYFEN